MTVPPPRQIRLRSARKPSQPTRAASIAAYMPAPPDPMIRTSVSTCMGSMVTPVLLTRYYSSGINVCSVILRCAPPKRVHARLDALWRASKDERPPLLLLVPLLHHRGRRPSRLAQERSHLRVTERRVVAVGKQRRDLSPNSLPLARGDLHRVDDLGVRGAAAEIAGEIMPDLIVVGIGIALQQLRRHQEEAR